MAGLPSIARKRPGRCRNQRLPKLKTAPSAQSAAPAPDPLGPGPSVTSALSQTEPRWLAECRAGLKAVDPWSQLLESLTGEPVKWRGKHRPNRRLLAQKTIQGILNQQSQSQMSQYSISLDDRKFRKVSSTESMSSSLRDSDTEVDATAGKPGPTASIEQQKAAENVVTFKDEHDHSPRVSIGSVDAHTASEMRQRMKTTLRRRIHSIREMVLKQRNENDAQKKYEHIPQKEKDALERAFFQYDADLSGYLEWEEVIPALRELGLSGSNAIEKREILQVCRNVMTATRVQKIYTSSTGLQQVLLAQRNRMQNQPRVKLGVLRKTTAAGASGKRSSGTALAEARSIKPMEPAKNEKSEKSDDRKSDDKKEEHGSRESRRSSFASSAGASSSLSEGSGSEDFDVGLDMAPLEKVSFDFLTFAGILVPKVRQRLTELQSTTVMRYFCNFDREGTGAISVFKCVEISRCLRMDQVLMLDALKENGFTPENSSLVDFDSFEQCVMSCREHTNRQQREREIEILLEMHIRPELFAECRDTIAQMYDIFRRCAGDAGSIGVMTANDAFLATYELGMMPRERWRKEKIKQFLVPEDAEDSVYMQVELNFEEFLEFLRKVRLQNDGQRLEELTAKFLRLDKDRNGSLDMKELHVLLEETQCIPRTRKEQEEVQQLIQSVDVDGNGVIDFEEFKELVQRIDEKFASLRYESEVEYAVSRGFTEVELGSFRAIFEHLDADNSGRLEMSEVRQCLSIIQHRSTWQAFDQTWRALDKDASGSLDFHEFIDFMRTMRDGEGVFAVDFDQKLPQHVNKLDERTLRSVLGHYGLSKSYLWALDKGQLMQRFCDCMVVSPNDSFQDMLKISTLNDLVKLAKEKGEALANLLL
ncbi:unnamed protein product [Effrenium voratum]|uniref:Calmodulin n=1 Tax=Effrenium voratum TaxID=2562239 RepID=A0AA36J776_9DINO|nr:unnamed protein product [Effrenium voratum]CAJ1458151.1 unnamed protein product [Effrenium voratum]